MNKKLTKAEIIENIKNTTGISSDDVHKVIDELFVEIKEALVEDRIIELRNLGTFELRTRKGKSKARNPKTGELVSVESHKVAYFRPGRELKQSVWNIRNNKEDNE
ncbi:MAG: integration host factor subunit beta [Sphaerochaetaceae bacterium]|nr:integration host factor subunit beta [Sphaerochaetaceae bacterium]